MNNAPVPLRPDRDTESAADSRYTRAVAYCFLAWAFTVVEGTTLILLAKFALGLFDR